MFSPSHLKTLYPLQQAFSVKPSSTISSMKLKRIVHTLIVSHLCRIIRALSKVKDVMVEILKENSTMIHKKHYNNYRRKNKIILGSFRLHYNWCSSKSSHVLPVPEPVYATCRDSGEPPRDEEDCPYLRWLEEKVEVEGGGGDNSNNKGASATNDEHDEMNEIDVLAEMFIANCHEKFRLEKQESDRRFHEMLARSM
ncbi:hypothetical protein AAZX31_03G126000 [Glycine max]|uniref:DUF761 domain-containing protein n=2 Tax=Glycine subgen. Soja TaxID=1462606 RepID=I1JNJ9_SOYBN|nr:uncharacterized protein LOC100777411 [Glycine max]XP_028225382.1 uncharacterized protein LOC114406772 [Glycine soja]KAG5055189.1 hypothetical protein JHK85_007699 [Glycine max]KAG5072268.1 hypothetical protein JHK86_007479 [Glycine max]KAH1070000.1 hypothetical protein GYH30_007221 [Glycine max]KAH1258180.1 hypothetical protein GmHk_03G007971 [Glycine max]KRH67051.1 hypothetical protein GLYMA_03G143800v4 [Glycine max]|eukprot:XP_003521210.1 uncharacterized protein LOC100777411 [Glycine max]